MGRKVADASGAVQRNAGPEGTSVPVLLDSRKSGKGFSMSRLTYFSIECDDPSPSWTLALQQNEIPFFMLGLSGIISQPGPRSGESRFTSGEMIDELFTLIEENEALFVDTSDLWLPNDLLASGGREEPVRGDVFRIGGRLFSLALRFSRQQLLQDDFLGRCLELRGECEFSETETEAFRDWARLQVKEAIATYPKEPKLALKYEDKPPRKRPG